MCLEILLRRVILLLLCVFSSFALGQPLIIQRVVGDERGLGVALLVKLRLRVVLRPHRRERHQILLPVRPAILIVNVDLIRLPVRLDAEVLFHLLQFGLLKGGDSIILDILVVGGCEAGEL